MEPRGEGTGPRTVDLLSVLRELNKHRLVLLCSWSVDHRQGLLYLIAKVESQDLGTGPLIPGPRVSDHGSLVLAA